MEYLLGFSQKIKIGKNSIDSNSEHITGNANVVRFIIAINDSTGSIPSCIINDMMLIRNKSVIETTPKFDVPSEVFSETAFSIKIDAFGEQLRKGDIIRLNITSEKEQMFTAGMVLKPI